MVNKKKENRGGFRENAKRPLKYGEPTEVIKFRVPSSKKERIINIVQEELSKHEVSTMEKYKKQYAAAKTQKGKASAMNKAQLNLSKAEFDEFVKWQVSIMESEK